MTKKVTSVFGSQSSNVNDIPPTTTEKGKASYEQGFPSETMLPLDNGGIAPDGKDFNGIFRDITTDVLQVNSGLAIQQYDDTFAQDQGGYPIGAKVVLSDNTTIVTSVISSNQNNPNSNMTGWELAKDTSITTWTGVTQQAENKLFVTSCYDVEALKNITVAQDRVCQITADNQAGFYKYESSSTATADDFNIVASNKGTGRWVRKTKTKAVFGTDHTRHYEQLLNWDFPDNAKYISDMGQDANTAVNAVGSFQVDEQEREIWLYCTLGKSADGTKYGLYLVVHDLDTGNYKFSFPIDLDNTGTACEGFVLTRYFGTRKAFIPNPFNDYVYEFDLEPSTLPTSTTAIAYTKKYAVSDIGEQMAFDEVTGIFYFESQTPTISTYTDRRILVQWNSDFTRVFGHIDVGLHNSGYVSNSQAGGAGQYFHKRQGFAVHGGLIALSFGGGASSNMNTKPTPAYNTNIQGVRLINMTGETIRESFLEPAPHIKKRNAIIGAEYYECEHEGVAFSNGKLYTLEILLHATRRYLEKGWALVEVMTDDPRATDFSDVASNRCHPNQSLPNHLDRVTGTNYINPLTGVWYSSITEVFDSMIYLQKPEITFHTSGIGSTLNDVDGISFQTKLPNQYITIIYVNPIKFHVVVHGYCTYTYNKGTSWTRVGNIVQLRSVTASGTKRCQVRAENYTDTASDIMLIDLQSSASANNLVIGGAGSTTTGATKLLLAWGNSPTDNTTINRLVMAGDNVSPITAGGLSLGVSSLPYSNIYSQTAVTVTSDRNYKEDIENLSEAELATAKACTKLVKRYKLKSSVVEKGVDARYHIGVIAQDIIQAFTDNGLDWTEYGIVTYDKWDAMPAEFDEDGNILHEAQDAGEKYMVRYEELMCFIIASLT